MKQKNNVQRLTTCAMLSALGVIILWFGAVTSVMEPSMAVLASLLCVFAVIEYGKSAPWLVFAVTGVLSLVLLPQKSAAAMYVLFFGYYPIIKEKLERLPRVLAWVWKEVIFNVALIVLLVLSRWLLMGAQSEPRLLYIAVIVLAEIVFPIYDIAMTRLISLYLYKLRSRFRIRK